MENTEAIKVQNFNSWKWLGFNTIASLFGLILAFQNSQVIFGIHISTIIFYIWKLTAIVTILYIVKAMIFRKKHENSRPKIISIIMFTIFNLFLTTLFAVSSIAIAAATTIMIPHQ